MKFIHKIVDNIQRHYQFYTSKKIKYEFVKDLPNYIKDERIYIIKDGINPDSLAFKCPCGCDSIIFLNLLKDAKPCWKFRITKKGNITISPSVWRKIGCKSHFFIREGRIDWVKERYY
jgi:hypothetical protein